MGGGSMVGAGGIGAGLVILGTVPFPPGAGGYGAVVPNLARRIDRFVAQ